MDKLLKSLRAIAEPTRLRILAICAHAELTASDIVAILDQSQPRVSRHLKLLVTAGLLERNQEGNWAYYQTPYSSKNMELGRIIVGLIPKNSQILINDLDKLKKIKQSRSKLADEYFCNNAADWEILRKLHIDNDKIDAALLNNITIGKIGSLLDIGTGTGHILKILSPKVDKAIGIDKSHEMLTIARANIDKTQYPNVELRHGDMYNIAYDNNYFDMITIHMVLHYAEYPDLLLKEASRLLRPNGKVILVDFEPHTQEYLREDHAHKWLGFNDAKIKALMKNAELDYQCLLRIKSQSMSIGIWQGVKNN